jgi:hypothetical protein
MVAFAHWGNYAADVCAILDHGIADRQILQGDFVSQRDVLIDDAAKLAVILRYDAEEVGAGCEILDDHHADVVAAVVHEQVRYLVHDNPRVTRAIYKR